MSELIDSQRIIVYKIKWHQREFSQLRIVNFLQVDRSWLELESQVERPKKKRKRKTEDGDGFSRRAMLGEKTCTALTRGLSFEFQ